MPRLFINTLKNQLREKLPGLQAHSIMSPSVRFTGKLKPNKTNTRESSVLIMLYLKNGELHIPFIKRPQYKGAHSGQVSLPGGKSEDYDNSALDTALRETEEEIGINKDNIEILGCLTSIFIPNSNFNVSPFVGFFKGSPSFYPDNFEVESIIEAPLRQLVDPNTIEKFKKNINNHNIEAPYFNIKNHQIWGATAMIISELKEIIQKLEVSPSSFYNAHNVPKSQ
ncbi:CoA pyrophosphatase [Labilibacter sediminis]|nr:CoA pyrophosphatase [Labilibacter sediminis]